MYSANVGNFTNGLKIPFRAHMQVQVQLSIAHKPLRTLQEL